MNPIRHFLIFQRTEGHCALWLARATSLRDALMRYVLEECAGAERDAEGRLQVDDGYGGKIVYAHPLACIEAEEKTWDGGAGWNGWEIRELRPEHWEADFAEVFCSENPHDIADYVARCRSLLRQRYPRLRARAFVWYLREGPLVTFYRRKNSKRRWPVEMLGRYLLPWKEWPQAYAWHGTYEDILQQMATEYPLPVSALRLG